MIETREAELLNSVPKRPPALVAANHDRGSIDSLRAALERQFNPTGAAEKILSEEIVRRAAELREFGEARATLRDQGEAALTNVLGGSEGDHPALFSTARAGAIASGQHEAVLRQELATARALFRAMDKLHKLQAARAEYWQHDLHQPDARFGTEEACCAYLARRCSSGLYACRRCGESGRGSFIRARMCWECGRCKAQSGLRVGTVMEHSTLPLTKWFTAIRVLLLYPTTKPGDLAEVLKISRVQTVRDMAKKIRRAIASETASILLAGLDEVYFSFIT